MEIPPMIPIQEVKLLSATSPGEWTAGALFHKRDHSWHMIAAADQLRWMFNLLPAEIKAGLAERKLTYEWITPFPPGGRCTPSTTKTHSTP